MEFVEAIAVEQSKTAVLFVNLQSKWKNREELPWRSSSMRISGFQPIEFPLLRAGFCGRTPAFFEVIM
jgi:hypothetical protein